MRNLKDLAVILIIVLLVAMFPSGFLLGGALFMTRYMAKEQLLCSFTHNEAGPQGWWYDVYKCSDGSERRILVASPRG